MSDGGYRHDSESMLAAKASLERAAEKTAEGAGKPTLLTAKDFGRVHGDAFTGYSNGINALGDAMKSYAGQLLQLGGGVGAAAARYSAGDQEQGSVARDAGRS
ncbi:hypothetical protein [Amycolatopsis saalfeldensis]|uniref:Excreted virulence factor EspC, type VII ESX diderm n=1 Tax=Amycolatopsis saalfeldensis TaxID=394193 RepID=A0A1H8YHT7_9PSEU|nr:hypothetical protein [Amycolatopsis saalfeldensis]SEP51696.1 hypothetical protein SAMN04489732_11714 [Amycolatopsis saalfeldensis]